MPQENNLEFFIKLLYQLDSHSSSVFLSTLFCVIFCIANKLFIYGIQSSTIYTAYSTFLGSL